MIRSLWTASSGMYAQMQNIDIISNNLANVNTSGFKKSRADFQDLLYETINQPGAPSSGTTELPTGIQAGHGTRLVSTQKLFSQGDYQNTGNELDIAIEGDGFFKVLQPNGQEAYTRAGAFKPDRDGRIVNPEGYALDPGRTIPADARSVTIGQDGTVSVLVAGQAQPTTIGSIELTRFVNPAGLMSIGRNLYVATAASGNETTGTPGEDGFGTLAQGFLEMSNVSVIDEMVNMITAQRAYEINSKAVQTADDMLQIANNIKR